MKPIKTAFSQPQNQSKLAVVIFFADVFYRVFRGGGLIALIVLIRDGLNSSTFLYIAISAGVLGILSAVYGVLAFLKFKFHINFDQDEFILQKGVLTSSRIAVPFNKIQQVYLKRSLLQRLLNIYSLKIDTAGSKEDEVDIKALPKATALQLKELLLEAETAEEDPTNEDDEAEPERETQPRSSENWYYKVSVGRLLKIGLSSNWFRGIWIMLIFFNQIYQEIQSLINASEWWQDFEGFIQNFQGIFQVLIVMTVAFLALVFIGMIITLAEVFIKYYNLNIKREKNKLHLEMGLTTTSQFTLKARRVQLLKIITNPIQKHLDLFASELHLSNSQDNLDKTKVKLPGLEDAIIEKIKKFLYTDLNEKKEWFKPHKALLIRRWGLSSVPVIIGWLLPFFIQNLSWSPLVFTVISILYILPMFWFQYKVFQSYKLDISDNFIVKTHGLWTQKTEVIELFKLQGISTNQAFWFKNRGIENITFHTAGGDLSFPLVKASALNSKLNYIIYTIETTDRDWM